MGNYNTAVITENGLEYITKAIAGEITLTFSHMAISDYEYPAGTNLSALTALQGVKMTVEPASVWVDGNTAGVRGIFSNQSVSTAYNIETIGVYVTDGTTEVLFSVSTATTPDEMPAYNGVAPSSFIFTVQETINEASTLSITVTTTGVATAADIADLQAQKQNNITGAATSVVSSNLTANRALVSSGNGKIAVSNTTAQELGRLHGVTDNVQTQLDGKQDEIVGGASSIVNNDLTPGRALASSASGKVAVSAVTAQELGRLAGVTSNVQNQLNAITDWDNNPRTVVTTPGTDLNDYRTLGIYFFTSSYTPYNIPDGVAGYLIVLPLTSAWSNSTAVKQLWLRYGSTSGNNSSDMWERMRDVNGVWTDWIKYATKKDVSIGAVVTNKGGTVSVPSGDDQSFDLQGLNPGVYLIQVSMRWANNGTGYRKVWLSTTMGGGPMANLAVVSCPAVSGDYTYQNFTYIAPLSEQRILYVVAKQTSGVNLDGVLRMTVLQLKGEMV